MKRIKYLLVSIVLITTVISCEFLEEEPYTDQTPVGFYSTPQGFESIMNGSYARLREILNEGENFSYITDLGTDLWEAGIDGKPINDRYTIEFDGDNKYTTKIWENLYEAINYCNYAIKYADIVEDFPADLVITRRAEARYLRAFYYFIVVQTWGGVHFSLEATEGVETEANKTPVDTFYNAIIRDLNYAVENLPETQPDYGRAHKYAAMMLLSRVLLTDTRSDAADYQRVAELAEGVISSGKFELLEDRESVWEYSNQKNKEVIWSAQMPTDPALQTRGGRMHVYFVSKYDQNIPGLQRSVEYGRSDARLKPTSYYLSLFDMGNDSRYKAYFREVYYANRDQGDILIGDTALFYPNVTWPQTDKDSAKYRIYDPDDLSLAFYPSLSKWDDPSRAGINDMIGTKDHIVFRLAETYLLAAEAYWRLNNKAKVLENINVIREAGAYPGKENTMTIADAADNELMEIILRERALELGGEQNRFFDLKRFGILLERVRAHHPYTEIQDFHKIRPISLEQIERCSNDFKQNPGYLR